jgi:predicted secreted protein
MTASAVHAFGTLLKMEDTPGSGTYTTVAELREVPIPSLEGATIDVTTHESPSGVREYIANIPGLGDLTFDIFYRPSHATHDENTGLLAKCLNRTKTRFKVVYNISPSKVATFDAFVTRFAPRAPVDNVWTANVRMQVASVPTWAAS